MGYAILDPSREPMTVVECGMVLPPASEPAMRLVAIADALERLIRAHAPVALAIERLYFNRNARTAMAVAEARGIALLCGARAHLVLGEYTPQEVKLAVAGSGSADKRGVQRMLSLQLSLREPITEDNVADAVAIAVTHAVRSRSAALMGTA